ncbi:hypothetical protein F7Q99_03025 [Streptomyces kaniharaensis]|uniref:Tetratricopeptide repeat protein n=1 Tax=Streptomyces kaniharaensis TaxID=212423 RepID=A0A6N7KIQ7_9ACTN|nr:hypothetical protein [Streptomyces kaniharaensis]MQS11286.1 hypothetical protein [Streptomyces kaniharaensis]
MAQLAVLLIVVALAGVAGVLLVRRRRALDPESVTKALARAAERLAAGRTQQARRRYAQLAGRLAAAPEALHGQRGLALLGQAEATAAAGDAQAALALHREAFPLLVDPARQLPRWSLHRLAEERMRAPGGDLGPLLAFLQATAGGAEPGAEAEAAARALDWLQRLCREGPPEQRETATRHALAALPGRDWPVLARAAVLRGSDRAAEAEALLAGAVRDGGGELWFRWGAQLFALHRDVPAVAAFDEALRRAPGEAYRWSRGPALRSECLLFRGLARQRLGETEAAWTDLQAAADQASWDPRPRYALGRLSLLLGADDRAAEQFTAALAAQPAFAPARFGLALVHERAERPAEAAADYRAGLDLAPDWRPARVRLGAALLAAGRTAEAEPLLRAEAGDDSRWGRVAAFHHGLACARSDDPAGALARWEPLREHGRPGDDLGDRLALVRDRLARRCLAADPATARQLWQQAAADDPAAPGYRQALREAALREAAHLLVTGRDRPETRAHATEALALADSLAGAVTGRQGRLRAALALAEGRPQALPGLLDPAAGPRDRYHLAAAALLAGRPVQTVALLAPLEADPAGDPALARLRAVLAERAGNWAVALAWHRHFLSAPGPAGALPPGVGGTDCAVCARPAAGACGGCGREACAAHLHRPADAASPRCVRCVGPALRAVLDCARRAGTPELAEPALAAWADALGESAAAAPVRLDLALLRAELGRLDEALAELPEAAARERTAVLVRRAAARLDGGEPGPAAGDLREALRLTPDHAQAAATLAVLAEHEAHGHALAGRRREAWHAYRALLLTDPAHPRLLHALGLAGYRLASGGGAGIDERVWEWTIGCLVAALYQPDLWAESVRVTGRPAEPPRIAAARAALTERLREDLRALDRAAGRSGDEVTAWTVLLGMEAHSADAFAQEDLRIALPGGPARRLVLGPTLARLLRREPELADWGGWFDEAIRPARSGGSQLARALGLFGELGPQRYLLIQGRQAAAVSALDAIPEAERGPEWEALLGETLVSQARAHHRNQDWREALDCLTRALDLLGAELPDDVPRIAAESGLRAARALLKSSDDDQQGAAELLERAFMLAPDHAEVRGDLGATYAQWARKINNETKDYPRALTLLRKSLVLAPGDPTARHFMLAALGNRAGELSQPDSTDEELTEAADRWRELASLDPDPDHRLGLAYVLRRLARSAALAEDRPLAVARMTEALDADPEWDGDPAREAPRRIGVMLANHVLDNLEDSPFRIRADILRKALSYDDSPDVRRLMVSVWRGEAIGHYEAGRFSGAARLLEEALGLSRAPEDIAKLHTELGVVYGAFAVNRANARAFREARQLIRQAVEHDPDDRELRALQRRINALH